MTPENKQKLQKNLREIAEILYQEASWSKIENLAGIEETIRDQTLEFITPQLGIFFSKRQREQQQEESELSKV